MKVTFIGLGIMGSRMAKNLLKNKLDLTVYNRSKDIVKELVTLGAKTADSAKAAVKEADIVFTMLSKPEVVQQVALDFLPAMQKGAIWIDSSTVNPSFSLQEQKWAETNGVHFMDAPVAGTLPHAQNAELVFYAGGPEEHLAKAKPLMEYMGQKVMHMGEVSKGASFKMLVNALLAQSMVIFSETVLLGEKMDFDSSFLLQTLSKLPVVAPFTQAKAKMIEEGKYEPMFPLELMQKDLHLAATTAYELEQPLLMANLAKEIYAKAKQKGLGRKDFGAVHEYLKG